MREGAWEAVDQLRRIPGVSAVTVAPTEAVPNGPSRLVASRFRSTILELAVLAVLEIGAMTFTQIGMWHDQVAVLHALGASAGNQVRGRVLELPGVVVFVVVFEAGTSWLLHRVLMAGLVRGVVVPGMISLSIETRAGPT